MKKFTNFFVLLLTIILLINISSCSLNNSNNIFNPSSSTGLSGGKGNYTFSFQTSGVSDLEIPTNTAMNVSSIIMPKTVEISCTIEYSYTMYYSSFFGSGYQRQVNDSIACKATGFFINSDGYLVTNAHVVTIENEDNYQDLQYTSRTILLNYADSNVQFSAQVIDYDVDLDLAILKTNDNIENLQHVVFYDLRDSSAKLFYGEPAIAIGNANGYGISVTSGIVSAPLRLFTQNKNTVRAIQTDAAINSGNSGGPLSNSYGAVIGVNSFKIVTNTSEALGYAIPSDVVLNYLDHVNESKKIEIDYSTTIIREMVE